MTREIEGGDFLPSEPFVGHAVSSLRYDGVSPTGVGVLGELRRLHESRGWQDSPRFVL